MCSSGSQSFGRCLASEGYTENQHKSNVGTAIVRKMNILALSEGRWKEEKSREGSGTTDGRRDAGTGAKHPSHPSETTEGYNGAGRKMRYLAKKQPIV